MLDYRNLDVWRLAHELTLAIYRATRSFPPTERAGLISQLQRAAASIGSNIAEGCGHDSPKQLIRFLGYAKGSASEVGYQLLLARDLGYIDDAAHTDLAGKLSSVRRMLHGLQDGVRRRNR